MFLEHLRKEKKNFAISSNNLLLASGNWLGLKKLKTANRERKGTNVCKVMLSQSLHSQNNQCKNTLECKQPNTPLFLLLRHRSKLIRVTFVLSSFIWHSVQVIAGQLTLFSVFDTRHIPSMSIWPFLSMLYE